MLSVQNISFRFSFMTLPPLALFVLYIDTWVPHHAGYGHVLSWLISYSNFKALSNSPFLSAAFGGYSIINELFGLS